MKHIKPISEPCLRQSLAHGGCTVANQSCANKDSQILAGRDGKVNHSFGK